VGWPPKVCSGGEGKRSLKVSRRKLRTRAAQKTNTSSHVRGDPSEGERDRSLREKKNRDALDIEARPLRSPCLPIAPGGR